MRVKTTFQADEDIIGIYLYGFQNFGRKKAEEYHEGLMNFFQRLADYPFATPERAGFVPPVRLSVYESHLVIYTVGDDHILIVRVLHGRQDWEKHLSS